jgi:Tfp pilus assembly protein FimT
MEMVVVLAIIVVLAGLAFPFLDALQAGPRLSAATDQVRARLTDARAHAVEDHQSYRFAVKDGTGQFKIAPDTSDNWPDATGTPGGDRGWVFEGSLPEKVKFAASDGGAGSDWHTVATFQPDGTATDDVEFTFQTSGAAPRTLRLRASTGSVTTLALTVPLNVQ